MNDHAYMTVVAKTVTTTGETCYLAMHPELPGCMASGTTEDEAQENLADARELYLSTLERRGIHTPSPMSGNPTTGTATVAATGLHSLPTAQVAVVA